MKKLLILLLALLLMTASALGEEIIINKIADPNNTFAFPEDTQLLEIFFPKISGCDAALVRYGEYALLIDCAGNQWRTVEAMLKKLQVTDLTYALNSHPDADHIGGFNHVLKNIPAGEFLHGFPEDFPEGDTVRFKVYNDLHTIGIPFRQVQNGETIPFGDVEIQVFQYNDPHLDRVNNCSVVLRIELGERSILFPGDIQRDGQLCYVDDQTPIQSDILKFPHHGYKNMNPDFLSLVSPELVVLTSGRNSAKGVSQLKDAGITHYFTERDILHLVTDGKTWLVERIK
nr:MBL fold metallo-hydrolase [Clostridia bacterium]